MHGGDDLPVGLIVELDIRLGIPAVDLLDVSEDPDVIVIGELRDLETVSLALTAAETGHLVMGTLHTGFHHPCQCIITSGS